MSQTVAQFFEATEPLLRRALVGGFGPEVGREAAAEALTHGWTNWDRVAGLDNPAGYLYRVGERWALRQVEEPLLELIPIAVDAARPLSALDAETNRTEPGLQPALETLSQRQRQAVVLVSSFGMSQTEAADLLGISKSSIQNHVERGMAKLRAALGVDA